VTINQLQSVWTGWSGAPGYTSFYIQGTDPVEIQDAAVAIHDFWEDIAGVLPNDVTIGGMSTYRTINEGTGALVAENPLLVPTASVVGASAASFAAPAGLSIEWLTSTPATSRLVKGRTYIVPIQVDAYQADGTLVEANRTVVQTAAALLVSTISPLLVVWRRPVDHAGGAVAEVTAARVNDRVAILRSRRS